MTIPTPATTDRLRYRPARHPGRRDSWTPAAILAALRTWTDEMGGPPRRTDWTGEHRERAGTAQRRWMREHPRWPSSSCVARHFGSWSAALEAAELPARRLQFPDEPAARVATARRLAAAGLSRRAIAEEMGVSRSSVHNYLNAGTCERCGGPTTKPDAAACRDCTRTDPSVPRAWTRADVREAIRDWTAAHGRPPTYRDWTPSRSGTATAHLRRPSAAIVCGLYADQVDPWNGALRDAGVRIHRRSWDDAAVRLALANLWAHLGRAPVPADLRTVAWTGPGLTTLRRRYGGLDAAWKVLGPAPDDRR